MDSSGFARGEIIFQRGVDRARRRSTKGVFGDFRSLGSIAALLHESRRAARSKGKGELMLLDEQDRRLWDAALIAEGCVLVEQALRTRRFGPYCLQTAITAVHAEASSFLERRLAELKSCKQ